MEGVRCSACCVVFANGLDLREHSRSKWHEYNVARKAKGFPPVNRELFIKKMVLIQEAKSAEVTRGSDHISNKKLKSKPLPREGDKPWFITDDEEYRVGYSLFDTSVSETTEQMYVHIQSAVGFHIPDEEYLVKEVDLPEEVTSLYGVEAMSGREALLIYLGRKVWKDKCCIYCSKEMASVKGVQDHMREMRHQRLNWFNDAERDELEDLFYDYSASYATLYEKLRLGIKGEGHRPVREIIAQLVEAQGEDIDALDENVTLKELADVVDFEAIGWEELLHSLGSMSARIESNKLILPDGRSLVNRKDVGSQQNTDMAIFNESVPRLKRRMLAIKAHEEKLQLNGEDMTPMDRRRKAKTLHDMQRLTDRLAYRDHRMKQIVNLQICYMMNTARK